MNNQTKENILLTILALLWVSFVTLGAIYFLSEIFGTALYRQGIRNDFTKRYIMEAENIVKSGHAGWDYLSKEKKQEIAEAYGCKSWEEWEERHESPNHR